MLLYLVSVILAVNAKRDGYTSYPENALCVYTNAARFDGAAFARSMGVKVGCGLVKNLGPVCFDTGLSQAARAHSKDMAANTYFEHDSENCGAYGSCDWSKRIKHYAPYISTLAENILAGDGISSPDMSVAKWVQSPGHCVNIQNHKYDCVGHGVGRANDDLGFRCTQDFGKCPNQCKGPIICGGHMPYAGSVKFVAAIYTSNKFDDVYAVVNGKSYEMQLEIGSKGAGQYGVKVSDLDKSKCNSYSFEIRAGYDAVDRYPSKGDGSLLTNSYGSCSNGYDDKNNAKGSPPPTPAAATSSPPPKPATTSTTTTASTTSESPSPTVDEVRDISANMSLADLVKNITNGTEYASANSTTVTTHPLPTETYDDKAGKNETEAADKDKDKETDGSYGKTSAGDDSRLSSTAIATISPFAVVASVILVIGVFAYRRKLQRDAADEKTMTVIETPSPPSSPTSDSPTAEMLREDPWSQEVPMTPTSPSPLLGFPERRVQRQPAWKLLPSLLRLK